MSTGVKGPRGPTVRSGCGVPGGCRADHDWQLVSARDRGHPKGDKSVFMMGSRADDRADEDLGGVWVARLGQRRGIAEVWPVDAVEAGPVTGLSRRRVGVLEGGCARSGG
jgi:hypothetical protein